MSAKRWRDYPVLVEKAERDPEWAARADALEAAVANLKAIAETPLARLRRVHGELMGGKSSHPKLTLIRGGRDA